MPATPFERSLAVVIGIDRYRSGIPELRTAVNDARRLGDILSSDHGYELISLLDEEATAERITRLLTLELPERVGPDDRVCFYFAGHGVAMDGDEGPNGYLVPVDGRRGEESSFLHMPLVHDALLALPCRHMMVFLDSCFSGAFRWSGTRGVALIPEVIHQERYDRFVHDPAWQVITSASQDQEALDHLSRGALGSRDGDQAHSPFAMALFAGLAGDGDVIPVGGGDGVITATELYLYLEDALQPESTRLGHRQTPRLWPLKKHDKGEFIFLTPGRDPDLPPAPELTFERNPYRGLSSYERKDAKLFFGRDEVIADLRTAVEQGPLTVVLGASGTGKSSVVKAGLLPRLAYEDGWHVLNVVRPGGSPLRALVRAVAGGDAPATPEASETAIAAVETWCDAHPGERLVLVMDQFEELATLTRDPELRNTVLNLLAELVAAHPDQLRLVLTLRSDFESQFDRSALSPWWTQGRYVVPPPTRRDLQAIIEEPASTVVLYFAPQTLVEDLVDDVAATPGGLPLLSFTLSEMYIRYVRRESDDRSLIQRDYNELGGVVGALRARADEEFAAFDEAQQATARRVLLRMVVPERGNLARRRVLRDELEYADEAENGRVADVIGRLTGARLVVEGVDEDGVRYVEPAHDALVRAWGRLLEWIHEEDERQSSLRFQHELARTADEWEDADGAAGRGLLWRDPVRSARLRAALKDPSVLLNRRETDFARRSVRRRRNIQWSLGVFGSMIVLAGIAALWFGLFAESLRLDSLRETRSAQSNQLTNSAVQVMEAFGDNAQAVKLAAMAVLIDSTNASAGHVLRRALYEDLFTYRDTTYAGASYVHETANVRWAFWTPESSHVIAERFGPEETVVLGIDGTARLRVLGRPVAISEDGGQIEVAGPDFSSWYDLEGTLLLDRPESVLRVDQRGAADTRNPFLFMTGGEPDPFTNFYGAVATRTGLRAGQEEANDGSTAFVVRTRDGSELGRLPGSWTFADFTADGRYLLTGSTEGEVVLWEVLGAAGGSNTSRLVRLTSLGGHTSGLESIAFSADESNVLTLAGGRLRIWTLTARPVTTFERERGLASLPVNLTPEGMPQSAAETTTEPRYTLRQRGDSVAVVDAESGEEGLVAARLVDRRDAVSRDGAYALVWSGTNTLGLLEAETRTIVAERDFPEPRMDEIPIFVSDEGTVYTEDLWYPEENRIVPVDWTRGAWSSALSPEGTLALQTLDTTTRFFDAEGREVAVLPSLGRVPTVEFASGGRFVVRRWGGLSSSFETVEVVPYDPGYIVRDAWGGVGELSPAERQRLAVPQPLDTASLWVLMWRQVKSWFGSGSGSEGTAPNFPG